MSSSLLDNLFSFGRSMPSPFDTCSPRIDGIHSRYSSLTISTICPNIVKAINAYCACMNGSSDGAIGIAGDNCIAEYKSSVSDKYHIVVYNKLTGKFMASVYDISSRDTEVYQLDKSHRDGAALMFAMMPVFIEDEEFREQLRIYSDQVMVAYADKNATKNSMAILCDNVYRRIKDGSCSAYVKVQLEASGTMAVVPRSQIESGEFIPDNVIAGDFSIFSNPDMAKDIKVAEVIVEKSDFEGKYTLRPRVLSSMEAALVPKLPDWYIVPQEVLDICKHAVATTGKPTQMRNFLLRGPAGTGKTKGAQAIAAGLGLPYMKYTCSANSEIYDFIGQMLPVTEDASTGDAKLDKELKQLKAMGGLTYENISRIMHLPDTDDMEYDPSGVFKALTGIVKADATPQDCMREIGNKIAQKVYELSKRAEPKHDKAQTFTYTETDLVKALEHGYVIEIQEPTVIMQPGVLVGLNSLLEQDGSITLPTGKIIKRHPDAVVVVTTNMDYEGCRGMNQSFIDRMSLVRDISLPPVEIMAQRAMSVTGAKDLSLVKRMVNVVYTMAEYCRKNSIADGTVGMRSLMDWILSAEVTGDVYSSALYTVISKATADEDEREALITSVLEQEFRSTRRRVAT